MDFRSPKPELGLALCGTVSRRSLWAWECESLSWTCGAVLRRVEPGTEAEEGHVRL